MKFLKDWKTKISYITIMVALLDAGLFAGIIYQIDKDIHAVQERISTTEVVDTVEEGATTGAEVTEEPTVSGNDVTEFQVSKGTKDVHTAILTPEGSASVTFNIFQ